MRSTSVRMTVPGKTPVRIERHEHLWKVAVEDPLAKCALRVVLGSELRHDDNGSCTAGMSQVDDRLEYLPRRANPSFDRLTAPIRNEQAHERGQSRRRHRW